MPSNTDNPTTSNTGPDLQPEVSAESPTLGVTEVSIAPNDVPQQWVDVQNVSLSGSFRSDESMRELIRRQYETASQQIYRNVFETVSIPVDLGSTRRSSRGSRPSPFSISPIRESGAKRGRKTKARKSMEQFVASRGLRGALPLIKCGFEFEFHKLKGPNSNQFDEFRFTRDLAAHMSEHTLYTLLYHFRRDEDYDVTTPEGRMRSELWEVVRKKEVSNVSKLPPEVREVATAWERILQERAVEKWTRSHRKRYISPASVGDIPNWATIEGYTELGTDGSVRGGEIRTQGGRTVQEFLRAARVLSQAEWEVDLDTSFHIHLSLANVEHRWGARLQAEMYAYLIANRHRMPEAVQRRLLAPHAGAKYARFRLENGHKYCAIYRHDEYNTWEFRLFGAVSKYSEMVQCLTLAIDTLRHAYSVKLGQTPSLLRKYSQDQIEYALEAMYPTTEPVEGEDVVEGDDDGEDVAVSTREVPGTGLEGFFQCLDEQSLRVRDIETDAA